MVMLEIVKNTVIFNNYSFDVNGFLMQDGHKWSNGFAPELGNATLYMPSFQAQRLGADWGTSRRVGAVQLEWIAENAILAYIRP